MIIVIFYNILFIRCLKIIYVKVIKKRSKLTVFIYTANNYTFSDIFQKKIVVI